MIKSISISSICSHKKIFGSGTTTLIIPNEEMNDIMKIVKLLEEFALKMKQRNKKEDFLVCYYVH